MVGFVHRVFEWYGGVDEVVVVVDVFVEAMGYYDYCFWCVVGYLCLLVDWYFGLFCELFFVCVYCYYFVVSLFCCWVIV